MGALRTNRPAAAASGTLAKTPLVHLLIYALEKKLNGTIELTGPDGRAATLLFIAGEPAKAQLDDASAYLGRVLTDLGYLSERERVQTLSELMKAAPSAHVLHGQLLVSRGVIDTSTLETGLREQLVRKLRLVSSMSPETTYAYYHDFDALHGWGGDVSQGVDPVPMLWGLLRESTPRNHMEAALARVHGSSLRIAKSADIMRLGLGPVEHAGVEHLRARKLTLSEFPRASGLPEEDARLLAYLLLVTKQVDVIAAGPAPPRTSAPPRSSTAPRPSIPPMRPPAPSSPAAPPSVPPLTPMPPSPRTALAKSLFPPGHVSLSKPPPGLSPELSERWTAIVDRARTIDRADYFAMLDLARDATREEAQASYFSLVKKWHPDRLPPELSPVRDACSRVFARMTEAYATLTDDEQYDHYMKLLAEGAGSPEMQEAVAKAVEAAGDFQKADVCFKRHDYVQAEAFCRKAVKADATQPDYLALLGWLLSLKPESQAPEKLAECIQLLDRAVALSERCERAYFWRGMLNKRYGKPDAAFRDFRRAYDLNPRNIDAAREVRLYNMRGGRSSVPPQGVAVRPSPVPGKNPKPDDKSGILGRLFKK